MTTNDPQIPNRRRPAMKIALGAIAALVALGAFGLWMFFRDDAPTSVSLDAAIESLDEDASTEDAATTDDAAETADAASAEDTSTIDDTSATSTEDISRTWTLDTETGDFDYESATGSFVGFRIEEELNGVGSTTAVGRTGDITGTMTIDGTTVVAASFEIDMTTITTNSSMRDDNVQEALETGDFPTASFVLSEPIELGAAAAQGERVSVTAVGDLTVHGVTNPISFAMDAQLVDGSVIAVGAADITFADYGVEVPDGGPVISVDDFGVMELQFLFG